MHNAFTANVANAASNDASYVPPRLILAPMEGVSGPSFRSRIAALGGVGLVCTEFVRISRAPLDAKGMAKHVIKSRSLPLSVQVMGNEADKMAEAARLIEEAGADVIDINVGCPMPRVVRKGVGAALLKKPEVLRTLVVKMRRKVRGKLSVKLRAGWDDTSGYDAIVDICRMLEREGCDFVALHPRKRSDFYQGAADWSVIKLVKQALTIPVVGNGDVWRADDVLKMSRLTSCDAVMIGRPALRNPWIFAQAHALITGAHPVVPAADDVWRWVMQLDEDFSSSSNPLGKLKEHIRWLGCAFSDQAAARALLRTQSRSELFCKLETTLKHVHIDCDPIGQTSIEKERSAG